MSEAREIHIGTSGWHYEHWVGPFYPKGLSADHWLGYYSEQLETVEINNTFYQLPSQATFESWRERVDETFVFAVKASRYVTHMKKLKDPEEPVRSFISRVETLGALLGPILFQLPPNWNYNGTRLRRFVAALPVGLQYAFELRDPDWINDEAEQILANHGAAFCIYDLHGRQSPRTVTADFVYIRLHGPYGPYRGKYDTATLAGWAGAIASWRRQGKDIYCYFDNDEAGYAAENALELRAMLE